MQRKIASIAIDDEAGLAKCLERGGRAILGESIEMCSMWGNFDTNLDALLVFPNVGRLPIGISMLEEGKFVMTPAEAARTVARYCVEYAQQWRADPEAFALWYRQKTPRPH